MWILKDTLKTLLPRYDSIIVDALICIKHTDVIVSRRITPYRQDMLSVDMMRLDSKSSQ